MKSIVLSVLLVLALTELSNGGAVNHLPHPINAATRGPIVADSRITDVDTWGPYCSTSDDACGEDLTPCCPQYLCQISGHDDLPRVINMPSRISTWIYTSSHQHAVQDLYLDLPRVINMPSRIYLARGLPARINCTIDANPPVIRVVWTRNDRPIIDLGSIAPPLPRHEVTMTSSSSLPSSLRTNDFGSLLFRSVEIGDEGRYACVGFSAAGAGSTSTPVQVLVREPPYFTLRPNAVYQRRPAQSITIPCVAEADPTPSFTWHKVGGELPISRVLYELGNLTIWDVELNDHGMYECTASNQVASSVTSTLLIVEAQGIRPPNNVTVVTTSYSATITWYPAFNNGLRQRYVLWFKESSQNSLWQTVPLAPEDATSATVYNLHPSTAYSFVVFARTMSATRGDVSELFSAVVNATTSEGPPVQTVTDRGAFPLSPTAYGVNHWASNRDPLNSMYSQAGRLAGPINVTVVLQPNGSILISWEPSVVNSRYKVVRYYTVQFRTVGHWVLLTAKIPANKSSFLWTTASRGVTYYFRVIAYYGSEEHSDPSVVVSVYTGRDRPNDVTTQTANGLLFITVGTSLLTLLCFVVSFVIFRVIRTRRREEAIKRATANYFSSDSVLMTPTATLGAEHLPSVDSQTHRVIAVNQIPFIEIINVHETPI